MSQPDSDRSSSRRVLSALADGDATDGEAARLFQAWREDDDARATWHAYQVIGDVMRSDDLARGPAADQRLLLALRARLAEEPVVLAPVEREVPVAAPVAESVAANARRSGAVAWPRGRWQAPLAMAAGFLAVVGGFDVVRGHSAGAPSAQVATAAPASGPIVAVAGANVAVAPTSAQAKADAEQLAPYLAAHRQSTMSGTFQMPGADFRNVSMVQSAP